MVSIKSFKALRPTSEKVNEFSAKPYDIVTYEEVKSTIKKNPHSFLKLTRSEALLDENISPYDSKVYELAKKNYLECIKNKTLNEDKLPSLYIYRQILGNHIQTGIVCLTSISDYINDFIKKHEKTREDKENDRTRHIDILNAQLEPVFLAYKPSSEINNITDRVVNNSSPIYDFVSDDNVRQILWQINDNNLINKIINIFEKIDYLYIADGHHRAASAVKTGLKRKSENVNHKGDEAYNFFLSVVFPSDSLMLLPYQRVLNSINNLTEKDFIEKISSYFTIKKLEQKPTNYPQQQKQFYMYIGKYWFELCAKKEILTDTFDPVLSLDVSILQNYVFDKILNIKDPRTDKRLDFIGGLDALQKLQDAVDSKKAVAAFALHSTSIDSLMKVADKNLLMPPKSTWFEPKLRSGLFVHSIKTSE